MLNDYASNERRKIIIVDDLKFSLLTVKDRLKDHYQIYPAQTVDELYKLLCDIEPELILLDIGMPEIDGFEVIKQLKGDIRYKQIPVIFLSAKSDRKSIVKGLSLGGIDFIIKPFHDIQLIDCIENHLDPSRADAIKPIIMAIDDNPSILRSIKSMMDGEYKVYTLTEPQVIHEALKKVSPDLFLLDYKMPVINGFELVQIIRNLPRHQETPIIFLTSEGTIDNLSIAISLGSTDFIVKPIDEEVLKQKVKDAVKNYMVIRLTHHF